LLPSCAHRGGFLSKKRILIKLSGEILAGAAHHGIDPVAIKRVATDLVEVYKAGYSLSVVIGGGNIYRGTSGATIGINRATADYMGMLATIMNALALQSTLETFDVEARVLSAIPMPVICEPYARRRALRHVEKGRIVIFAAGSGNPHFTTDTAAALRASEMGCTMLLKGTKVPGVYDVDPVKNPKARFFKHLTYKEVLEQDLFIMDPSAITLARSSGIPIVVFSILESGNLLRVLRGGGQFSVIQEGRDHGCVAC
jgi:uridylate kinase